jgi:flagellar hook-associated protein 3 FlgL
MRLLKFVANSTTLSSSDISNAMDLASKAVDAVATVQAKLGNADAQIKTAQAAQVDYQNYAKTLDANLTGVDVAAVTAQLATYQAQLSASFSALAKIQSLSLVSYLR